MFLVSVSELCAEILQEVVYVLDRKFRYKYIAMIAHAIELGMSKFWTSDTNFEQ